MTTISPASSVTTLSFNWTQQTSANSRSEEEAKGSDHYSGELEEASTIDSDDYFGYESADAEMIEACFELEKESERVDRSLSVLHQKRTFVPDIFDSIKYDKDGMFTGCIMMADRAAYSAYLKHVCDKKQDLFSVVYEDALSAYMKRLSENCGNDGVEVNKHIKKSEAYANDICIQCVIISHH